MNDLISRQAAIEALKAHEDYKGYLHGDFEEILEALPSAQSEIIRCKDCKYYVIHTFFGRSQGWCERLCDEFDKSLARGTEPDDYCSRAEPKGEQECTKKI